MMWSWLIHLGEWWCFGIRVLYARCKYIMCVVKVARVLGPSHLMKPASWPSNQIWKHRLIHLLSSIVFLCPSCRGKPCRLTETHLSHVNASHVAGTPTKIPRNGKCTATPNLHPGLWSDPTGLCGKQVDSKLGLLWNGTRLLSTPCEGAVVGPKLQVQVGGKLLLVPWLGYEQWTMLTTSGSTWNVGTWRWASFFRRFFCSRIMECSNNSFTYSVAFLNCQAFPHSRMM